MSNSLQPHKSQYARPPCPSQTPRVYSNACPSSQWCHPAISSSVVPLSSCPQSLPASGSFLMSQLFTWGGQSTGVSASTSVLPMNNQDLSSLGWTGWISLQSKKLSLQYIKYGRNCMCVYICVCMYLCVWFYKYGFKKSTYFFQMSMRNQEACFLWSYSLMEIMKSPKLQDILIFPFIN